MLKFKPRYVREIWNVANPDEWITVNTKSNGGENHYGVKLWSGKGYSLSLYSVWADSEDEALTIVGEWCAKHDPKMVISEREVFERQEEWIARLVEKTPEKFGLDEELVSDMYPSEICQYLKEVDKDEWYSLMDEALDAQSDWVYPTENPDIYLRSENLFVNIWPSDYPDI